MKKPSHFLTLPFPVCSIFGECWHEMTAVTYLEALVAEGDTWQKLTPKQVAEAMEKVENPREKGAVMSILMNEERLERVADALTSAEDAEKFSFAWRTKDHE
jgi:uncharacterized membrane-anchored protein YjiN (DUF445 family)